MRRSRERERREEEAEPFSIIDHPSWKCRQSRKYMKVWVAPIFIFSYWLIFTLPTANPVCSAARHPFVHPFW